MRKPSPKKLRFSSLLLAVCFPFVLTYGQIDMKETVFDEMIEIGMFKQHIMTFEFKEGEEFVLNINVMGGRKIKKFIIDQPVNPLDLLKKKLRTIERQAIQVPRDGEYVFTFKNKGILKKSIRVRIDKYPRKQSRDTMILDDIMVSTTIDTVKNAYADTIGLPDVSIVSFELQPSLDYKTTSDSCFVEQLLDDDYQFAVYWVGIGEKAKREYDQLKANPPPSWLIEGINEPLFAYAKGLTEKLPSSTTSLYRNIRFAFKDPNGNNEELERLGKNPPPYGVIPVYKAGRYKKLRMCFRNYNTSTRVPVYVIFAKFRLKKSEKLEIIKRERVQEIFIKKPVISYDSEQ